ncbi:glycine betaine ABC transporter substrate-binding protein [Flexistipes sp.]|uniref:glycine betaine ABC transporter substrate-binding protein n=1 Tax=Flexistipes sp. TaxID=3088135 RepID=UPI002E24C336|nr:glycine betaine ABC transporter substrate-binding protein [Flexistipes sp.]
MKKLTKIIAVMLTMLILSATAVMAKQEKVTIPYVEWARCVAITHVAGGILEDLGYDVQLRSVANAAMWASVNTGDSDALMCAWLPLTHGDLYKKYQDGIENAQTNYEGAVTGLVVPSYVKADSISELADYKEKFNGEIIGIDPGAGMSKAIDKAIKNDTSNLGEFRYVTGSGAIMMASLDRAIKNNEWIVVPLWKPHWAFGAYDLKVLKDKNGIFSESETIDTIVRKDLKEDDKLLYSFFSNFDWTKLDLSPVLLDNKNQMAPSKSAEKFIENNKEKINKLLEPVKEAAK